jgi:hypothetical protein
MKRSVSDMLAKIEARNKAVVKSNFDRLQAHSSSGRLLNSSLSKPSLQRSTPNYPSATFQAPVVISPKVKLSGEMEAREKIAQEEVARKKKRVGILVNKSSYQYISDGMDLTTLGKK